MQDVLMHILNSILFLLGVFIDIVNTVYIDNIYAVDINNTQRAF